MHITLKPNERIFINGAVLRVDRKVSIELMNDAVFLLESHVMLEEAASSPIRRLYFIVQLMLIEPQDPEPKRAAFERQGAAVAERYTDGTILIGLATVGDLVRRGRLFEALKLIRSMIPVEDQVLAGPLPLSVPQDNVAPQPVAARPSALRRDAGAGLAHKVRVRT